jgi:small subunit ribosomal protein S1
MEGAAKDLAPWEVPPDESYWHALLNEGEHGEGSIASGQDLDPCPDVELDQQAATEVAEAVNGESYSRLVDGESACWDLFLQYQAEDKTTELPVVGFNRGGLLVRWDGVVGFVPASQLCEGIPYGDEQLRLDALAVRASGTLTLKVIEANPAETRLVLSERAAMRVHEPDLSVLDDLTAGNVRHGRVTNLCSFGVFVDLGGVEGLIHISELSWGRVARPADVLQSGQEIEVYVLNVDRERGRVGLSIKRLHPDPWDTVKDRYSFDQVVEGTVTNVVNFGAFVRIEEGVEGLIHASDLTDQAGSPHHALQEGVAVRVRIVSIDQSRHRMGLNLEGIAGDELP